MRQYILGVDPGAHGAIALIAPGGELAVVADMPTVKRKRGPRLVTEINLVELSAIVSSLRRPGMLGYIERVGARPGQGVSSMFAFGRALGQIEGVLVSELVPCEYVTPQVWRRGVGLVSGADKAASRARAQALFPADAKTFGRAKDDGRAEAVLIAYWGTKQP